MDAVARLHITGPATDDNSVPAEVLVRAIEGLQQGVWLLAAAAESRTIHKRFKPDQAFRQQFTLRVAAPERGSYVLPLGLTDERCQRPSSIPPDIDLLARFAKVWTGVAEGDLSEFRTFVADESLSIRLLQIFKRILPKRGDRWSLAFGTKSMPEVELDARHRSIVDGWLKLPSEESAVSIIGELQRIDFAAKLLWIFYSPNQSLLQCPYREELEDSIVEARQQLFQVIGQFALDPEGHPKQIVDVRSIEIVDLSPVLLHEIQVDDGTLFIDPPLTLNPALDGETQQFFVAELEDFNLILSGPTRDALLDDLADQLGFIWREYGEANEDELTDDAIELRRLLRARLSRARAKA